MVPDTFWGRYIARRYASWGTSRISSVNCRSYPRAMEGNRIATHAELDAHRQ
ncbi:hypothetical protein [Allofournierella massiliensis]|uniref:hypothetical protein n=1 Tax=Allofournierella massiliensis TaxID=1650663 RepID=UPI00356A3F63